MNRILLLIFCLISLVPSAWANTRYGVEPPIEQNKEMLIRGVVLDNNGVALPGASVLVKGSQSGRITDFEGLFQLSVKEGQTLVISFIGMKSQEVLVSKTSDYRITLDVNSALIDEIMVTGYQTLSKERSTGAFAKVTAETFELKRMNNLNSMLEGQVAGLVNGQLRGSTTINAIGNPLVVIDGFPVENISLDRIGRPTDNMPDINPEDIESINILKDAAAASIYGARAANGVIIITTKKAKQGKTDISFSSTLTINPYSHTTRNRTNAADVISMERQWAESNAALIGGGAGALAEAGEIRNNGSRYPSKGIDILLDMYTDKISMEQGNELLKNLAASNNQYYDQVKNHAKRNSVYQQYNVRVGKTTERNSFNLSTSYWRNEYENRNHNDWKLGVNITNSLNVTRWLQVDIGTYLKYGKENTQTFDPLNPGYTVMPYDALVAPDGSYIAASRQGNQGRQDIISQNGLYSEEFTPMDELNYQLGQNKSMGSRTFGKLKLDFTPWLNYNVMFQYETERQDQERLKEMESSGVRSLINDFTTVDGKGKLVYNLPNGNIFSTNYRKTEAYTFRQQINVNKTFADKHNLVWILGQEVRHTKLFYDDNIYYGYEPDLLSWLPYNTKALTSFSGLFGYKSLKPENSMTKKEVTNRFVSVYSNASYTYDDKYVLSGSIRWDKSNLWGSNIKAQNKPLWSIGGSWNIYKESFFYSNVIDMLKLRVSYGIGGNIARNSAPYLVAGYYSSSLVDGVYGVVKSPPNADIRWEKTSTTNIGVDFSMFNHRLSGSVEYYNKLSVDLLASTKISATQGFAYSTLQVNNGEMLNRGFELTLKGNIIKNKDLVWNTTLLYAFNKNKVRKTHNAPKTYKDKISFPLSYPTEGRPLQGIYAFKWAGLSENGDPQVYNKNGEIVYEDLMDPDALQYCGTSIPVHSGSLINVLRYKGFEMSIMIIVDAGHKIRGTNIPTINMTSGFITPTSNSIANRWKNPGDETKTDVPRLLFSNDRTNYNQYRANLYAFSDQFVYNATNIRLNNISLSYRLPSSWCKKLFLDSAKLQFNVENAAIITANSQVREDLKAYVKPNYVLGLHLNF